MEQLSSRVVNTYLLVPVMSLDLNHVYNTLVLGYRPHAVAGGFQGLKMDTCLFWDSLHCSGLLGFGLLFWSGCCLCFDKLYTVVDENANVAQ